MSGVREHEHRDRGDEGQQHQAGVVDTHLAATLAEVGQIGE